MRRFSGSRTLSNYPSSYTSIINVNARLWIKISLLYRKSWLAFALIQYFCKCILSNPRQDTLAAILRLDICLKTVYDHKKTTRKPLILSPFVIPGSHCKTPLTLKKPSESRSYSHHLGGFFSRSCKTAYERTTLEKIYQWQMKQLLERVIGIFSTLVALKQLKSVCRIQQYACKNSKYIVHIYKV